MHSYTSIHNKKVIAITYVVVSVPGPLSLEGGFYLKKEEKVIMHDLNIVLLFMCSCSIANVTLP